MVPIKPIVAKNPKTLINFSNLVFKTVVQNSNTNNNTTSIIRGNANALTKASILFKNSPSTIVFLIY